MELLTGRGALFGHEIAAICGFDSDTVLAALGQLVGAGLVTSDGFGGLRLLVRGTAVRGQLAGRWSLVQTPTSPPAHVAAAQETADEERIEFHGKPLGGRPNARSVPFRVDPYRRSNSFVSGCLEGRLQDRCSDVENCHTPDL